MLGGGRNNSKPDKWKIATLSLFGILLILFFVPLGKADLSLGNQFIQLILQPGQTQDPFTISNATGATLAKIDVNGNAFTKSLNATNITAKNIGGVIYADQYPTIQAAVNASSVGDEIFVPRGTYLITSPITGLAYRKLQCEQSVFYSNPLGTQLIANGNIDTILDMTNSYGAMVSGCILDGNSTANYTVRLDRAVSGSHQNRFEYNDFAGATIALVNSTNSEDNEFIDNRFSTTGALYGLVVRDIGGDLSIYDGIFTGNSTDQIYFQCTGGHNCVLNIYNTPFTNHPADAQIYIAGNVFANLFNPWMEVTTVGANIKGGNDALRLNIFGGLITVGNTGTQSSIQGSFTTLNTFGSDINGQGATYSVNATITNFYDYGSVFTKPINKGAITTYGILNKDQTEFMSIPELLLRKQYARVGVNAGTATSYFTLDGDNAQIVRNAFHNVTGWFRVDESKTVGILTLDSSGGYRFEYAPAGSGAISFTTKLSLDNTGNLTLAGLSGTGNGYVCVTATGKLYRNVTAGC